MAALKEDVPDLFLLENVDLGDRDDPDSNLSHIVEMLESCGYRVNIFKVSALEYGLPHRRMRIYMGFLLLKKQPHPLPGEDLEPQAETTMPRYFSSAQVVCVFPPWTSSSDL